MPRVDHHLQHLGFDFASPDQIFDRILQRLDSLAGQRANVHDASRIDLVRIAPHPAFGHPLPIGWGEGQGEGQHQFHRQIHFVPDDDSFLVRELGQVSFVLARERL